MTTKDMPYLLEAYRLQAKFFTEIAADMTQLYNDCVAGLEPEEAVRRTFVLQMKFNKAMFEQSQRERDFRPHFPNPAH